MAVSLILTHPGGAHKDELLACCLLAAVHRVPIVRREPTEADLADAILPVTDADAMATFAQLIGTLVLHQAGRLPVPQARGREAHPSGGAGEHEGRVDVEPPVVEGRERQLLAEPAAPPAGAAAGGSSKVDSSR